MNDKSIFARVLCVSLLLLATLFALSKAPFSASFWQDELITIWITEGTLTEVWSRTLKFQAHSPFYFMTLWFWKGVVGSSELALRSLSGLFIAGGIGLAAHLCFKKGGFWSLLFALAGCISLDALWLAAIGLRPYGVGFFFHMLSLWLWERDFRHRYLGITLTGLRFGLAVSAVNLLSIAGLFFLIHAFTSRLPKREVAIFLAVGAVVSLPSWLHFFEFGARFQKLFGSVVLAGITPSVLFTFFPPYLYVYVLGGLAITAIVRPVRLSLAPLKPGNPFWFSAGCTYLVAFLLILVAAVIFQFPFFDTRYALPSLIFLPFLVGASPLLLQSERNRALFLSAFLCFFLLREVDRTWFPEPWREAVATLRSDSGGRHPLVFFSSGLLEGLRPDYWESDTSREYLLSLFSAYPIDASIVGVPLQEDEKSLRIKVAEALHQAGGETPIYVMYYGFGFFERDLGGSGSGRGGNGERVSASTRVQELFRDSGHKLSPVFSENGIIIQRVEPLLNKRR